VVQRGKLLAYLNTGVLETESGPRGDRKRPRRVMDREDLQSLLPFGETA
jgi:hypothetical protein